MRDLPARERVVEYVPAGGDLPHLVEPRHRDRADLLDQRREARQDLGLRASGIEIAVQIASLLRQDERPHLRDL